jgi:hypothetical protein
MSNAVIRVVSNRKILKEAAYAGNIGIMELIKFKSKATPEQKKKFDEFVKNKKAKEAWKLVQSVTGVKLHKSVTEEKKSPNTDLLSVSGAGQDGTDTLVNNYNNDTPGQGLKSFKDYQKKK